MNSEDESNRKTDRSCSCPFCDQPMCPDPADSSHACNIAGRITVHRVDCVGLYCPVPVMRAKEEIDKLKDGSLMELVADDPASAEDIPRWAKRSGNKLLKSWQDNNEFFFLIQKTEEE